MQKEQAVYVRLKAKYIGRKKKRIIINKYCGFLGRFKRKFWFIYLLFLSLFFPLTIMKVRKVKTGTRYQIML